MGKCLSPSHHLNIKLILSDNPPTQQQYYSGATDIDWGCMIISI